jgi:hypothetical protein
LLADETMASLAKVRSPSLRESTISMGVLAVLGIVLAGVLRQQARFDPAVTVAATAATAASQGSGAATVPDIATQWPAGLRAMSAAEAFTPATLSDKIDGKAELYLSANFVALTCQRVALTDAPGAWMEVFLFDMGKPANAFAVYSSQKRPDVTEAQIGDYAYVAGNQLCLVHGKYYIELVGADDQVALMKAADGLARYFVATLAVADHANMSKEQALFPPEGLIAGTVSLVATDVFGFDRLQNVFIGRYREGPDEMPLFITNRGSPAAATQMAGEFRGFLVKDCGGKETPPPAGLPGAILVDMDGSFDGVFTVGPFMAGVHQAPSRAVAERMLQRLYRSIQTSKP